MTKHVAFSKPDDEVGEPSVEFYLYDYCDSQSVVSEAPSIDLGLLQEQQQQQKNLRSNMAKISRGHEKGMGNLLKKKQAKRSSLTSEMSGDFSIAENSFWDNEENSFAEYAQFGGGLGGGGGGSKGGPPRNGSIRMSQLARTSFSSDAADSFWNSEENSFADYMQFGAQNLPNPRMSAAQRSGSLRFSELRFDHDDVSLSDSVLSMGSFALDGDVEIEGFEALQDGSGGPEYKSPSKAALMDSNSMDESWSISESVLKGETNEGEEDLRDVMPQSAGSMRRAERRAQRARDRVSAYSRTPSRNGSIGSISSNIPRRNGSLGKYSDHSHGSISLASSGPKRNGSLGKYSDHSRGSLASSSGVVNIPRRSGSLGKYSDHSGRSLSNRRVVAGANPRRTGSIGGAPLRSQSAHGATGLSNSNHGARRSTGGSARRHGSLGKAHSARMLGSSISPSTIKEVDSPATPVNKKQVEEEAGSPTLRQRNGKGTSTKIDDDEVQSPTVRQRNGKGSTKNIVSPRVAKAMKQKLLGAGATDLPNAGAGLLAGTIKRKSSKLKMGKDSDHLPRGASLRQQLLG